MKELPCFNVRTQYSILDGVVGTVQEVQQACKDAGITSYYIADVLNTFGWQEIEQAQGISLRVYEDGYMNQLRAPYFSVSIYAHRPYSHASTVFDFFSKHVSVNPVGKWNRTSVVDLRAFLKKNKDSVYAITLHNHANKMEIADFPNVYFEYSWRDLNVYKKSLFCQYNQTALPGNYFAYQMVTKFKMNDIPHIVPLDVLHMHAKMRGYDKVLTECPTVPMELPVRDGRGLRAAKIPTSLTTWTDKELFELLRKHCEGVAKHVYARYRERLVHEIDTLEKKDFMNYIFLVADIIQNARQNGIIVGAGRGSSCGSLVCFLLGITRIDPIKYGLLFERFIDVDRNDMPDIDIDFDDREAVIALMKARYENVSKMGTVLTIKYKKAIETVGTIIGIPPAQLEIGKNEVIDLDDDTDVLENIKAFKDYPKMDYIYDLYGRAQAIGTHASGVLVADKPLNQYVAIDESSGNAQISKAFIERRGLLKIDVLGLMNLAIIKSTLQMVGIKYDDFEKNILSRLDEDHSVWDVLKANKFLGIFQAEGSAVRKIILRLYNKGIPMTFQLMSIITAISRVGGWLSGAALTIADNIITFNASPSVRNQTIPFLRETYGKIVYQEQIMKICEVVGKFTTKEVTAVRKIIAKKVGDLKEYEAKFIKNGTEQGYAAVDMWNEIKHAGSYAFNKSHAVAYSVTTYMTAYLKTHHPKEFYCALLTHAGTGEDAAVKRGLILAECKMPVGRPSMGTQWVLQGNTLLPPMTAVKGIGDKKLAAMLRRGEPSPSERELMSKGVGIATVPQFTHKNYSSLPEAYPVFTQSPNYFVVSGRLMHKFLSHVNAPSNVAKTGVTRNLAGIGGKGNIINFRIFTGVHIYGLKSRWDKTTARMLDEYYKVGEGDIINFFVEAHEYGFAIVDFRKV